jgi:hypothetical protein
LLTNKNNTAPGNAEKKKIEINERRISDGGRVRTDSFE